MVWGYLVHWDEGTSSMASHTWPKSSVLWLGFGPRHQFWYHSSMCS